MGPRTAVLLLYFARTGPAPYSEFAIPHMYGRHVHLRPFVLKVRNMELCQHIQRSTTARGNYAHCHCVTASACEDFVFCLRDRRTTPRVLTWCVHDSWSWLAAWHAKWR